MEIHLWIAISCIEENLLVQNIYNTFYRNVKSGQKIIYTGSYTYLKEDSYIKSRLHILYI